MKNGYTQIERYSLEYIAVSDIFADDKSNYENKLIVCLKRQAIFVLVKVDYKIILNWILCINLHSYIMLKNPLKAHCMAFFAGQYCCII